MDNPRFFLDAMLGNVAKKLRLLGFDARYSSNVSDEDLIQQSQIQERIIVSRDEKLVERAKRLGIKSILITSDDEIEQFRQLKQNVELGVLEISGNVARCPRCNSDTRDIERDKVIGKVPDRVFELNSRFWICDVCDQIYWEGTHIQNLQKFVSKLNDKF